MATIKGVWLFNNAIKDKITGLDEDAAINVSFTSNGTQFSLICYATLSAGDANVCHIYYDSTQVVEGLIGDISTWTDDAYKTVDFGTTAQTVPDTFLAWMQENATQQASEGETTAPTAESVKSKLQSLITASNAKTGKSDANLTDAVKTLLEGYGQGGGGVSVTGARKFAPTITTEGLPSNTTTPITIEEYEAYATNPPSTFRCAIYFNGSLMYAETDMFCGILDYEGVPTLFIGMVGESEPMEFVQNGVPMAGLLLKFTIDIIDAGQYGEWLLANTTEKPLYSLPAELINEIGLQNAIEENNTVAGAVYIVKGELYVIEEQDGTLVYKKLVKQ